MIHSARSRGAVELQRVLCFLGEHRTGQPIVTRGRSTYTILCCWNMYDTLDTILCCWNLYDPFVRTEGYHGGENAWADIVRILAILRDRSIRAVFDNPGIQFSAVGKMYDPP